MYHPYLWENFRVLRAAWLVAIQDSKCSTAECNGNSHLTGMYSQSRSMTCSRKDRATPDALALNDVLVKCPTPGCNGRGHVNTCRNTHRSISGCPIAAMEKMAQKEHTSNYKPLIQSPTSFDGLLRPSCYNKQLEVDDYKYQCYVNQPDKEDLYCRQMSPQSVYGYENSRYYQRYITPKPKMNESDIEKQRIHFEALVLTVYSVDQELGTEGGCIDDYYY